MRCLCEAFIGENDMSKGVVLRIQPLFMKKTFIFPMLILRHLPELAIFFQKKCLKSLEDEKKSLPLHPQNERGDAVESAPVLRKSDL